MFAFAFIFLLSNSMVSFCEPIRSMTNCIIGDWSSTNVTWNVMPMQRQEADNIEYCNGDLNRGEGISRCNSISALYAKEPAFKAFLHKESEIMKIQFNRESKAIEIVQP
ncbi:hypothetical protein PRIPAC_76236 [Pristionchus pacificus]|uniref:Uncharacterized protein n=1 Tax=Pristionchus pacificus TaxID=54126 RepID=A0A2A6C1C8_PRIPA|nr:hypothetical protein PRIPAC_76236 [Pristionchus pacificus]|eukprot:PDM71918.1 hypothetical protein PRIPAC_38325 [Pristionchus pacificus]